LWPSSVQPRPNAKPLHLIEAKILPPVKLVRERQPSSPRSLSLSMAGISIPWTGANVTSSQHTIKETEDARNAHEASVSKGKSHALEILCESIGKTRPCPIKATIFGASNNNPTQQLEPKHTIGDPPPQLMHMERPPGNPPLNWSDNISTNDSVARTQGTNKVQTMEPAQPKHLQRQPQAGENIAGNPTWQLPRPTSSIMHTLLEQIDSTTGTRNIYWSALVATATDHTRVIEPVTPPQVIATMAPPALGTQATNEAQTMKPKQPPHQWRRAQAGEHIAWNPTWKLPSPTSSIMHTLLERIYRTTQTRNDYWSTPVATAVDHTRVIKPIAPLRVIATMAPPALAQQHTLVARPQQYHKLTPVFPSNLINIIQSIQATMCPQPQQPEFFFELTPEAAEKNFLVVKRHNMDLGQAITAQKDSPLGYGSEFKPHQVLRQFFLHHPLWERMESILVNGSQWPLKEISKEDRVADLREALTFGNHKGASSKPELLQELISGNAKHGYGLVLPWNKIDRIPHACIAPMNIMHQFTLDASGNIINKEHLTHNQSFPWKSGSSVNQRVEKEKLQQYMYGRCLTRLLCWILKVRRQFPRKHILLQKIDIKSAYWRCHLNSAMAVQTIT
jgi:hypothetical protein